jgi:hypothetical protein
MKATLDHVPHRWQRQLAVMGNEIRRAAGVEMERIEGV